MYTRCCVCDFIRNNQISIRTNLIRSLKHVLIINLNKSLYLCQEEEHFQTVPGRIHRPREDWNSLWTFSLRFTGSEHSTLLDFICTCIYIFFLNIPTLWSQNICFIAWKIGNISENRDLKFISTVWSKNARPYVPYL